MSAWAKRISHEDPERYSSWLARRNAKTASQTPGQRAARNARDRARYARVRDTNPELHAARRRRVNQLRTRALE